MSIMRTEFIQAYKWYYNETNKKANEVFEKAVCCADYEFINEIIEIYKKQPQYTIRLYD